MTFRAVILGFLAAMFIAGVGYINDRVLHLNYMVNNHFPISVFGLLILAAMVGNPILYMLRRTWRLRPAELAVIVALMLVACSIPGSGLLRTFTQALVMPIQYNETFPGWKKNQVLSFAPPAMLPAGGVYDEHVIGAFQSGMGHKETISLSDVPWDAWTDPLLTWMPIVLLMSLGMICLSLVVHRQWAKRERLRYPIADFAASVMDQDPNRPLGPIFRNRLFWTGLVVVLAIRVINGIHEWYPQFLEIPLQFDLMIITQKWPDWGNVPKIRPLFAPRLFPTVIAIAFFLSSDVGLSLGISYPLYIVTAAVLLNIGVDVETQLMRGGVFDWQIFGSFLGAALLILYVGRRHYGQVLKRIVPFLRSDEVLPYEVWAGRFFLLAMLSLVIILTGLGLAFPVAILTVALLMMMMLVMGRLIAETGLFFLSAGWQPMGIVLGLFGANALGPKGAVILVLLCAVLVVDPRESLMPFLINGLKICDDQKVRVSRMGWGMAGVFAGGLALAVPLVLWVNYNYGSPSWDTYAMVRVPQRTFNPIERIVTELKGSEQLESSQDLKWWERLTHMNPDHRFLWAAGIGLVLFTGMSVLRLRFVWWPLHPVLFLVWRAHGLSHFSFSFLLGWFIKVVVTHLGGAQKYQELKVLMIGIIAGDLLGGLIFMVHGAIYHAVYGLIPKIYLVFPS